MSHPAVTALAELDRADISAADGPACSALLGQANLVQGCLDAIVARLTSRLGVLHDSAGGAPASDVVTKCGGVSAAEGKRKERRSKTIEEAPSFGDALSSGAIGGEHVDALANATSNLDAAVKDAVFDRVDDLLADATSMPPEQFGRSCRDLVRRVEKDHGLECNRRQRRDTFLSRKLNPASGMIEGRFALHPELGNQIFGAVDKQVAAMVAEGKQRGDPVYVNRTIDRNHLAAEALGHLVAGGHRQARPTEADITVIVDHHTATTGRLHEHSVCETSEGAAIPPASIRRLLCQGRVTPIIIDSDGVALDAGRTIRNANRAQSRALRAMYRRCAFDHCDIAFDRCEIHHIIPWELGGPTDLVNLLPLCSRHHHVVHEDHWRLELDDDRKLSIFRPDGTMFTRCRPDITERHHRRTAA